MSFSIMSFSIMSFSIMSFNVMTLSIMTDIMMLHKTTYLAAKYVTLVLTTKQFSSLGSVLFC
jgi:hypothetical protein